jgi:hypothetical protein
MRSNSAAMRDIPHGLFAESFVEIAEKKDVVAVFSFTLLYK